MEKAYFDALDFHAKKIKLPTSFHLRTANGSPFVVHEAAVLPIQLPNNTTTLQPFILVDKLASKAILGYDFIQQHPEVLLPHLFPNTAPNYHGQERPILARTTAHLPPRSTRIIDAVSAITRAQLYADSHLFCVDNGIYDVDDQGHFKMALHNPTDFPLTIETKDFIGFAEEVQAHEILELPPPAKHAVGKPDTPISRDKMSLLLKSAKIDFPAPEKDLLLQLLCNFHDIFSIDKHDIGFTKIIQHHVRMKSQNPSHLKQFRIPEQHLDFLHKYVDQLLLNKCITFSKSPYNNPIFCVKKQNGELRIVQDFRRVNENSYDDKYCLPEIQQLIDNIGKHKSKIFTSLDLTSGFWQMQLHPNSQEITAFSVPGRGRFHWLRTPMGLKGSPASFQRLMDYTMRDLPSVQCYIDDILIHSPDFKSHIKHLEQCFLRIRANNLKLNLSKCHFGTQKIDYLGHTLTPDGVQPSENHLIAVKNFPEPQTIRKVREFAGLTNYFRTHISHYATTAGHLTALTKKSAEWKSGEMPEPARIAFKQLKTDLTSAPLLAYPQPNLPYILSVDAATGDAKNPGGLGAVLTQKYPDGSEKVIAYASRTLKSFEKNYTPYLLELQAATWAIQHFHTYLYGRKFTLCTDHRPLEKMSRMHTKTLTRLQEQMNEYDFMVQYRKGADNAAPDALSRNAIDNINFFPDGNFLQTQLLDPTIKQIYDLPEKEKELKGIVLKNNQLFKSSGNSLMLILPKHLQQTAITHFHGSSNAHFGINKTFQTIKQWFYWPTMHKDIADFITSCLTCQRLKGKPPTQNRAFLQTQLLPSQPNEKIGADLFGPIKESKNKNKYVLVMTDLFTKYAIFEPIPDKSAETVAMTIFNKWILKFGAFKQLLTDEGREFVNNLMNALSRVSNFKHLTTSSYHPQTNGATEALNKHIIKCISAAIDSNNYDDWEALLPMINFSYNTAVHKSTNHSPFFLTFLRQPYLPTTNLPTTCLTDQPWLQQTFNQLQTVMHTLKLANMEAQTQAEKHYNKRAALKQFRLGDKVLVWFPKTVHANKPHNIKFNTPYQGPYTIIKINGPLTYTLQLTPTSRPTLVHANRIILLNPYTNSPAKPQATAIKQQTTNQLPTTAVELQTPEDDNPNNPPSSTITPSSSSTSLDDDNDSSPPAPSSNSFHSAHSDSHSEQSNSTRDSSSSSSTSSSSPPPSPPPDNQASTSAQSSQQPPPDNNQPTPKRRNPRHPSSASPVQTRSKTAAALKQAAKDVHKMFK